MVGQNRFGRRNFGYGNANAVARNARPNTGHSTLNTRLISRGGFLRTAGVGAAGIIGAGLFGGGVSHAGHAPGDYVAPEYVAGGGMNYNVWPTGDPTEYTYPDPADPTKMKTSTKDVQNVQFCVDKVRAGGKVQLKSVDKFTGLPKAFNFGTGNVKIYKDVKIIGETDGIPTDVFPNGTPLTTVTGGIVPFYNETLPDYVKYSGPDITIQGIHFTQSMVGPILIQYCKKATVTGNWIEHILPVSTGVPVPRTDPVLFYAIGGGITIGTFSILPIGLPGTQEGGVTGNIVVTNNLVDCWTAEPKKDALIGIILPGTTNITGYMAHNKVINIARNGIESVDNLNTGGFSSHVTIEYNTVITAEQGNDFFGPTGPNCIATGVTHEKYDANTTYSVLNNSIEMKGKNLSQFGILALVNKAKIENNEIFMPKEIFSPGGFGIGLVGASYCTVSNNTCKTELKYGAFPAGLGVYLGPYKNILSYPPQFFSCTNNKILNNTFDAPPIPYPVPYPPYYQMIIFMGYIGAPEIDDSSIPPIPYYVYDNTFSGVNNPMQNVLYGVISCQEAVRGCTVIGCPGMPLLNTFTYPIGVGPDPACIPPPPPPQP